MIVIVTLIILKHFKLIIITTIMIVTLIINQIKKKYLKELIMDKNILMIMINQMKIMIILKYFKIIKIIIAIINKN